MIPNLLSLEDFREMDYLTFEGYDLPIELMMEITNKPGDL